MRTARLAAVAAGLALVVAAGTTNRVAARPQRLDRDVQVPPVGLCLDLDIDALFPPLAFHLHLGLVIGNPDCAVPPPSTTTTTTTTTTQPPPTTTTKVPPPSTTTSSTTSTSTTTSTTHPPPTTTTTTTTTTQPPPTTTTKVPPPSTTTSFTTSTSTTTSTTQVPTTVPPSTIPELLVAPEPPPPPPDAPTPRPPTSPPAPAQLAVTATMVPQQPAAGESATATITVRNVGQSAAPALDLTDVLQGAEVRSAGGGVATCGVVARRADCRLQGLAPGASTTLEVRLRVDRSPAPSRVAQQIRLAAAEVIVADRAVAVSVAREEGGPARLLEGPGTAVTLGAAFGLVLSARPRSPSSRGSSR